jgi:hypothetical protein
MKIKTVAPKSPPQYAIDHAQVEVRLLTPKEAARFLGIRAQTLAVWRCNGTRALRYIQIGRLIRYRFEDLVDFVQLNERSL